MEKAKNDICIKGGGMNNLNSHNHSSIDETEYNNHENEIPEFEEDITIDIKEKPVQC